MIAELAEGADLRTALRQAIDLERAGQPQQALAAYGRILAADPDHIAALEGAARTASSNHDHRSAVVHLEKALGLDPGRPQLRFNLAEALVNANEPAKAEQQIRTYLNRRPQDGIAMNLLGVALKRQQRAAEALVEFKRAARANRSIAAPWINIGNIHFANGDADMAVEAFRKAMQLQPKDSNGARLLGEALVAADRVAEGLASLDRAAALAPRSWRVQLSRASALRFIGESKEALAAVDKGLELAPGEKELLRIKGAVLIDLHRAGEAVAIFREILSREPDNVETLVALGNVLAATLNQYEEANQHLRKAVALRPDDPACLGTLCRSLLDSRYGNEADHIQEAGTIARRLVEVTPNLLPLADSLQGTFLRLADHESLAKLGDRSELMEFWARKRKVAALHMQLGRVASHADRLELIRFHREWGMKVEAMAQRTPLRRKPSQRDRSRIRLGLMSSDLRNHPVGYFAVPIVENYDRSRFEIYCYSFYPGRADPGEGYFARKADKFHRLPELSLTDTAQRIADDDLDMLIELGGSTRFNRLEAMAHKPAPLQMSWLGYPHSCGLSTIDYILVDPYINPASPDLLIERPFVMPESWVCFNSLGDVPIESGIPQDRAGLLTFGTMNNPYKYTPALFELWAAVMSAVPGSRFLFVRPEAGTALFRENVTREFGKHGIAPERLEFLAVRGAHLQHYNKIDICLDTAPQTGGTTTCESLWMGVPVVTLVGEAFFERLSFSNLSNAGLGGLCTFTPQDFVAAAVALAGDRAGREALRRELRDRIRRSPLGDTRRWVENFQRLIEEIVSAEGRPRAASQIQLSYADAAAP